MKGFQQRTATNGHFFVVKHNTICEESSKEREGYEPVEVMNPQTKEVSIKFIKRYDALEAMVTKIEFRDTGDQYEQRYVSWKIHLDANGESGVLEIPFNSRVGDRFMKLAENLNFSEPIEFRAWRDGEGKTAFIVKQEGQSVPQKYSKADPGKCPPPVQRLGGKWNFDDQSEFLHNQMLTVVIPKLEAVRGMTEEKHSDNGFEPEYHAETPDVEADRETLIGDIATTCKLLNEAGDSMKWGKASLATFINDKYQVEDGLNSLTLPFLRELRELLNSRLIDLDVPF